MKSLLTLMLFAGLLIGSAQATPIPTICATQIGNTDGKGTFNGRNAPYKGSDKYANWAIDRIVALNLPAPEASSFNKMDVNRPLVRIREGDSFVMTHWGGGKSGDQEYQLYDVSHCAPGEYLLPAPSQNGISWVAKFRGGRTPEVPEGSGGSSSVPDGGTTLILLGLALCGMVPAQKLLGKSS